MGIVEGSCGYRARGVRIRGKFGLSRNLGYKTRGCVNLLVDERRSDPWVAYPDVKFQVRDLVRVISIVVPFAPRGRYSGKFFLSRPSG